MTVPKADFTHPTPFDAPTAELLIATYPLLRLLRGDKREFFRRAWIAAALHHASIIMDRDEGSLPRDPRAAIFALHEVVLELADAEGISRADFAASFNLRGERGLRANAADADEAIRRASALLSVLCARRMEAA